MLITQIAVFKSGDRQTFLMLKRLISDIKKYTLLRHIYLEYLRTNRFRDNDFGLVDLKSGTHLYIAQIPIQILYHRNHGEG